MSDETERPLAERIAWRVAEASGWPEWMLVPSLGQDLTPVVERVLAAALQSGLVVTAAEAEQVLAHRTARMKAHAETREDWWRKAVTHLADEMDRHAEMPVRLFWGSKLRNLIPGERTS